MKFDIQTMTIPKIKRMLRLRLISILLFVLFTALTIASIIGIQVMRWAWAGSLLAAAAFVILAVASCAGFLFINNKLAGSGL